MIDLSQFNALLLPSERLLLYALITGLKPRTVLEIGAAWGGSAQIIHAALNGGKLVSIDRDPKPECIEVFKDMKGATLISQETPGAIKPAQQRYAKKGFDFAFIDGGHSFNEVRADIDAVIPCLASRAYLLFHDAHYDDVKRAIDDRLALYPGLTDAGLLTTDSTSNERGQWGGLRLLRWQA